MRFVIQRVKEARVTVNQLVTGEITQGLVVLVGIEDEDTQEDITWLSRKVCNLRIFDDEDGVMNRSLLDVNGRILLISQFTLLASTKKGNRPSYTRASKPDTAIPLYEALIAQLTHDAGETPQTGVFGKMMALELINDGPVTILVDSKNKE